MQTQRALLLSLISLTACEGLDPPPDLSGVFAACCDEVGTCVPSALVATELGARLARAECGPALVCAPRRWVEDLAAVALTCRSAGDLEGRCLPACLPDVESRARSLTQAGCEAGHLCVPCFDPLSGEDTQACRLGEDAPVEPPRRFARCCAERGEPLGTCLPLSLLGEEQAASLPVESCPDTETRCVPSELTLSAGRLDACTGRILGIGPSTRGLCLPGCFIDAPLRYFVPQGSCAAPYRCTACSVLGSGFAGCP